MRTLSSETSFVEMGEEKFFKWFPKFGTKSYQKYLNCMEILWVNKHALRRMYISHRSRFTEKKVFFWLKKLLLKWTSNFLNKKFFNLKNLFLINLLLLVNVLLWRATPSQLIKLFWRGYPFQPMLGLTSWMSWFPVPVTTFSIVPAYKTQVRWDAGTVAECGPSILYSGLLHCPEARGVTVLAGTVFWSSLEQSGVHVRGGRAKYCRRPVITGGWPRETCWWLGRQSEAQPVVSRGGDGSVTRTRITLFILNYKRLCPSVCL